jgi:hypothetical protein
VEDRLLALQADRLTLLTITDQQQAARGRFRQAAPKQQLSFLQVVVGRYFRRTAPGAEELLDPELHPLAVPDWMFWVERVERVEARALPARQFLNRFFLQPSVKSFLVPVVAGAQTPAAVPLAAQAVMAAAEVRGYLLPAVLLVAVLAVLLAAEVRVCLVLAALVMVEVEAFLAEVAALFLALVETVARLVGLGGLAVVVGAQHQQTKVLALPLAAQAVMARSFCCGLRGTNHEIRMD